MRLLLGTNNKGKAIEMSEALSGLAIDIVTPEQVGIHEKPDETGTTYLENAILKVRFFQERSGLPTVADDSGVVVDALAGELGVYSRRWGAGPTATDQEWIDYFLKRMENETNRRAAFLCTLAYIDPNGALHTFEGRCDGTIVHELETDYLPGLPLSAAFKPDGFDTVFSALGADQKNKVSHRGKALGTFREHVRNFIND